jgi:hypothetical protein
MEANRTAKLAPEKVRRSRRNKAPLRCDKEDTQRPHVAKNRGNAPLSAAAQAHRA